MTISMYAASVPVFKQMLGGLAHVLSKAEAHAQARKIDAGVFPNCRLAPDMFPLVRQVQIACDFAKGVPARLAGAEVPSWEDSEQTFADLQARIAKTLAFVDTFKPADIDGSEAREILLAPGTPRERKFAGQPFAAQLAVLSGVALLMTAGVYGLVAIIVKLDDMGLYLSRLHGAGGARDATRAFGRRLVLAAPLLMKTLTVVGTAAMFLVGGGILTHGVGPLHHAIAQWATAAGALSWGAGPLADAVVGVLVGAAVWAGWQAVLRVKQ